MAFMRVLLGSVGFVFVFLGLYFIFNKKIVEDKAMVVKLLGIAFVIFGVGGIALVVLL